MIRNKKAIVPILAGLALAVLTSGCSHQADNSPSALDQQRKDVMGSEPPPAVRAQIQAQQAQQAAAAQAAQKAAQQQAAQQGAARKP